MLGGVAAAPGHTSFVLLTGMNRLTYMLVGACIAALTNLGLSIVLTSQVGVVGPALGSLIVFLDVEHAALAALCSFPAPSSLEIVVGSGIRFLVSPDCHGLRGSDRRDRVSRWKPAPSDALVGSVAVGVVYIGVLLLTIGSSRRARYRSLVIRAMKRG